MNAILTKGDLLNKLRTYKYAPDDENIQYKEKIEQALLSCPELLYALHEEDSLATGKDILEVMAIFDLFCLSQIHKQL